MTKITIIKLALFFFVFFTLFFGSRKNSLACCVIGNDPYGGGPICVCEPDCQCGPPPEGGGSGGGSICTGCWPSHTNSMGLVTSTWISDRVASPASFTVNWYYEQHGCRSAGHFIVYIGTDRSLVNSNCAEYPAGCTAIIANLPLTTRSFNTATGGISLSSTKTYFVKVVTDVTYSIGGGDYETEICSAPDSIPFLGSCSLTSPDSGPLSVGNTRLFTTGINVADNTLTPTPVPLRIIRRGQTVRECDDDGRHCRNVYHNSEMHIAGYKLGTTGSDWVLINSNGNHFYGLIPIKYYDGEGYVLDIKYASNLYPAGFNEASANAITVSQISLAYNGNAPAPTYNIANVKYLKAPGTNYFDIITQSPDRNNPDSTSPYQALIRATQAGSTYLRSDVYATGVTSAPACYGFAPLTIVAPALQDAWWQVKDSDIQANGNITSSVPSGNYFGLNGLGGYPGVAAYGGSTNLTTSNVSENSNAKWLANSFWTSPKEYKYAYFANQIPSDITINSVNPSDVPGSLNSGSAVPDSNNYYWFKYDGADNGGADLTLPAVDIGDRKVILLVANANLKITGNVNLLDNTGFFMVIVGVDANGNKGGITVDNSVGGGVGPNLEGIYLADTTFNAGTAATQLKTRGSIVAYGGINMAGRDLGAVSNSTTPSLLFEYAPDQIMLLPTKFGLRKLNWKEVAP